MPTHRIAWVTCLALAAAVPAAGAQDPPKPAEPGDEARPVPPAEGKPAAPEGQAPATMRTESVIATRSRRAVVRTPRAVTLLGHEELVARGGQVLIDALHERTGLWVEHRNGTTGDPVMRGLAGGNILTMVDGNSLTTFWGEGGFGSDDMYGKIDPDSIERIEIVRGPASVFYGSQALGGVINLVSREVPFEFAPGFRVGGLEKVRFASADRSARSRTEGFFAGAGIRGLVGFSAADVNLLEGGRGIGPQFKTGGRAWATDAKLELLPSPSHLFTFTFRDIDQRDIQRYYRPTQSNAADLTQAMARWSIREPWAGFTDGELRVFYQKKVDTRYWEDPASVADGRQGAARTESYTADLSLTRPLGPAGNTVTVGVSHHLDVGESPDDEEFTERRNTWAVGPPGERQAGPDTWWWNLGAFLHDAWDAGDVTLMASGRVDYFEFATDPYSSQYYPTTYPGTGPLEPWQAFDDIRDGSFALTGGVGALWEFAPGFSAFTNASRGFRQWAPRFGFAQVGAGILAPSTEMPDPVISYSIEGGLKADVEKLAAEAVVYHTRFEGFLQDVRGTYQGQDWYDWNGDTIRDPNEDMYVRHAGSRAWVTGLELDATWRFDGDLRTLGWAGDGWWDGLSLRGSFAWNYGKDEAFSNDNLRHVHPARALFALRWDEPGTRRFWGEVAVEAVRGFYRVPTERLNGDPGYKQDPAVAGSPLLRSNGLPGYTVVNVRGGWQASEWLEVVAGVDNVGDKRYRRAHSRIRAEAGINAHLSVRVQIG